MKTSKIPFFLFLFSFLWVFTSCNPVEFFENLVEETAEDLYGSLSFEYEGEEYEYFLVSNSYTELENLEGVYALFMAAIPKDEFFVGFNLDDEEHEDGITGFLTLTIYSDSFEVGSTIPSFSSEEMVQMLALDAVIYDAPAYSLLWESELNEDIGGFGVNGLLTLTKFNIDDNGQSDIRGNFETQINSFGSDDNNSTMSNGSFRIKMLDSVLK